MDLVAVERAGIRRRAGVPVVAVGDDERVVLAGLAGRQRDRPAVAGQRLAVGDRGVERDRLAQAEVVDVVVEVLQQLRVVREVRPFARHRIVLEREAPLRRVDVQRLVARRRAVRVVEVPVATDVVGHLEAVVRQPEVLQPLGHREATTARSDDAGLRLLVRRQRHPSTVTVAARSAACRAARSSSSSPATTVDRSPPSQLTRSDDARRPLRELRWVVGRATCSSPPTCAPASRWIGPARFGGTCAAVVRPASTAEVARCSNYCNDPASPSCRRPATADWSVAACRAPTEWGARHPDERRAAIVLSLTRLDQLGTVDATVDAGHRRCGRHARRWRRHARRRVASTRRSTSPPATSPPIGGAIATNAGGSRVCASARCARRSSGSRPCWPTAPSSARWPVCRRRPPGSTGRRCIAGSEGTLAVVTAARLRLVPRFEHTVTAMCRVDIGRRRGRPCSRPCGATSRRSTPSSSSSPAAMELVA